MVALSSLWLPIALSAVFVFIASSILHMVLPFHRGDAGKLLGEEDVLAGMRSKGVKPGQYMFPCAGSMKNMGTPEMKEKYELGPVGFLTVLPNGVPNIGKCLVQWFLYSILLGVFVAYIATLSASPGATYASVFRLTGTVAILAYATQPISESIWKGQSWGVTFKFIIDGLVYGLVTAGTFGWLWPAGAGS